mmetsp:Transcript_34937/g.65185  ORF Transcript_34937/g.65185 Transcript_34937/m.65185 type:complete len:706 (+) Transcript_34937:111-2228(+)
MNDTNAGLPSGRNGASSKRKPTKKPKKLEPLEPNQLSTQSKQMMSTKVKPITKKNELIEAVRKVAPASVPMNPQLYHDVASNLKTCSIDDAEVRQQLSIVEDGVNNSARKYNDLRVICDRKATELKARLDELDSLKLEHDAMVRMKTRDTHEARRIDKLKVEIEEVETQLARSIHFSRQLDHMMQRLARNKIKFDAHMNGMQDTYNAVYKEWEEIRLMRRSLDSGLSSATLKYEETAEQVRIKRHERQTLLHQRKLELKNAHRLKLWMKERAVVKMELATELRGDLTEDEEVLLRTQLKEKEEKTKRLQRANEESQRRVSLMEESFQRIKQITGMSSLDDMVDKFSVQRINKKNLEKEVSDVEQRLAEAKKLNTKAEQAFQERKSSGVGEAEINRDDTITSEEKINAARYEYKVTKAASERLDAVLVALRQGANGLLQRVQPYVSLVDAGVFELTSGGNVAGNEEMHSWTDTMDSLSTAEQVLSKMIEIIGGGDPSPAKVGGGGVNETVAFEENSEMNEMAPSMSNNVRIRSRRIKREAEEVDNHTGPKLLPTIEDMSMDGSDSISMFSDLPDSPQEMKRGTLLQTPMSPNGRENDGTGGSVVSIDDHDTGNRLAVKKTSSRITNDAHRKIAQEQRRKKLAERMGAQGEMDESGLANMAKYKAQQQAMDGLSYHMHPPTLPKTVTLRDDPMTKTHAFLTNMPDLK